MSQRTHCLLAPACLFAVACSAPIAFAQRLVAYVPTAEATISGALTLSGANSLLGDASVVTALASQPAHLTLSRGGSILLCQASIVHLTAGQAAFNPKAKDIFDPLLIALENGGFEIRMPMAAGDSLETPEMRLSSAASPNKSTPLDLALRITANGDTCVENRDKHSPTINITDVFGHQQYRLKPGQHVLFQHGLIQEAVVSDTTSCGCPPVSPTGLSLADAALRARPGSTPTFNPNDSLFPFPSSGPEPATTTAPNQQPSGPPVQVAGTLIYDPATREPEPALNAATSTTPTLTPPPLDPNPSSAASTPGSANPNRHKLSQPAPSPTPAAVAASKPSAPLPGKTAPPKSTQPKPNAVKSASTNQPAQAATAAVADSKSTEAKSKPSHSLGGFLKRIFGR